MKFPTGYTYQNLHGFSRFPGYSTALGLSDCEFLMLGCVSVVELLWVCGVYWREFMYCYCQDVGQFESEYFKQSVQAAAGMCQVTCWLLMSFYDVVWCQYAVSVWVSTLECWTLTMKSYSIHSFIQLFIRLIHLFKALATFPPFGRERTLLDLSHTHFCYKLHLGLAPA